MQRTKEKDLNNAGKLDSGLYVETIYKKGINMQNHSTSAKNVAQENAQNLAQSSVFNFNSLDIHVVADERGEPLFLANDVCTILGYANSRQAIAKNCKAKGVSKRYTLTDGGNQESIFINEGNLYRLIIKSRKPEAEAFEIKVMEEILPSIRKTGEYRTPYIANPNDSLSAAQAEQLRIALKTQCDKLPKDKQGAFMTKGWSKLKSHFGCTYRNIPQKEFTEAISLVTRHVAEWELLDEPKLETKSSTEQMLSLLSGGRWLLSVQRGNLVLNPVSQNAFVVAADDLPMVIKETLGVPAKLLTDVISACASRLQYLQSKQA